MGEGTLRKAIRSILAERAAVSDDFVELMLRIDNSPYHMMPLDELEDELEIEAADHLAQGGYVKLLPADARFPERLVLTPAGSHAVGTFDWDTLRDER